MADWQSIAGLPIFVFNFWSSIVLILWSDYVEKFEWSCGCNSRQSNHSDRLVADLKKMRTYSCKHQSNEGKQICPFTQVCSLDHICCECIANIDMDDSGYSRALRPLECEYTICKMQWARPTQHDGERERDGDRKAKQKAKMKKKQKKKLEVNDLKCAHEYRRTIARVQNIHFHFENAALRHSPYGSLRVMWLQFMSFMFVRSLLFFLLSAFYRLFYNIFRAFANSKYEPWYLACELDVCTGCERYRAEAPKKYPTPLHTGTVLLP